MFKKLLIVSMLALTATSSAFAQHPNWIFPFLRGLTVATEELATNTSGANFDENFWDHHVKVRYNMGLAMARQLQTILPTIHDQNISMQLNQVIHDLNNAPHYTNLSFFWDNTNRWVELANQQQNTYQSICDRVNAMVQRIIDAGQASPDYLELPILLGITVATEGLVHADRDDWGDADLWAHHFDLRMNAAYAMERKLREIFSDLPPEHTAFAGEVLALADEIRSFSNFAYDGSADFWSMRSREQQDLFLRLRDRANTLVDMARRDACSMNIMP